MEVTYAAVANDVNRFVAEARRAQVAVARTPRERWVTEGLAALAAGGPDAVRVEALASALQVTKGGFYWHFTDRAALLAELLDAWERKTVDEVIALVEHGGGTARTRLRRLFGAAADDALLKVDLAVRDWARRDGAVRARLERVDNRRMDFMRSLFREICVDDDDVEVRCLLALALWVGNHFIAAGHGERSRSEVVSLALRRLLS